MSLGSGVGSSPDTGHKLGSTQLLLPRCVLKLWTAGRVVDCLGSCPRWVFTDTCCVSRAEVAEVRTWEGDWGERRSKLLGRESLRASPVPGVGCQRLCR